MSNNVPNFIIREYPLRVSDFDKDQSILPSAVLDIFQDVAGVHAKMLKISNPELLERGLCWMLTRVRYEIVKRPELYQTAVVKTWPIESRRIELDRDFEIYNKSGELMIRGSSQWVVMDITDRSSPKLVPARNFELGLDEYVPERAFDRAFGRAVYNNVECDSPYVCRARYTDLDMNGHVNNIKYADLTMGAIKDALNGGEIVDFRIDYVREILEGDDVKIHTATETDGKSNSVVLCRGETDGAAVSFGVRAVVKKRT